jgi:DNA-binding transcriptional MerR regulator
VTLRIGGLAELTGVTTKAIRHYHRIGLLPPARRLPNGYRDYGLADAVRVLRIRRLAELGMSLAEVADSLAGDAGRDMREILTELDDDLARTEAAIKARRASIATLLAQDDPTVPNEIRSLTALFGGRPGERLVAELLAPMTGATGLYQQVAADPDLTARFEGLTRRFDALSQVPADDPAVAALVAEAADLGPAVAALLPPELHDSPGDPAAAEALRDAVTADLSPAQTRCLTLMFETWQRNTR